MLIGKIEGRGCYLTGGRTAAHIDRPVRIVENAGNTRCLEATIDAVIGAFDNGFNR